MLRIALLQAEAVPLDHARNLETIADAALTARERGAELLLTPELFVTGYAPRELASWLTPERVESFPAELAAIAARLGIAIAASFPAVRADGSYAIAAGFWDASGRELLRYEKVHLWGAAERLAFTSADELSAVVQWRGRRIAFQICYDIEFPEPIRRLAELGADLVLVPTAIDGDSAYVPEVLVRARAAENGIVVAYADHAASGDSAGGDVAFAGLSVVAGPAGALFARAGAGAELVLAELPDPAALEDGGANYLGDYRPEVYAGWR